MAKILHLPDNREEFESVAEFMQNTLKVLEEEGAVSCLVVAKCSEGHVVTGYHKCDFGGKQELLGHIQADVIDQMIRSNPERY